MQKVHLRRNEWSGENPEEQWSWTKLFAEPQGQDRRGAIQGDLGRKWAERPICLEAGYGTTRSTSTMSGREFRVDRGGGCPL